MSQRKRQGTVEWFEKTMNKTAQVLIKHDICESTFASSTFPQRPPWALGHDYKLSEPAGPAIG